MFLPGLRNILNILIFTFLGIFLLTGILFWKLTTGPISLTFLTPYFEKSTEKTHSTKTNPKPGLNKNPHADGKNNPPGG